MSDRRQGYIAAIVFVFLCCVYLLSYRGLLSSIDELALFSKAEEMAGLGGSPLAFAQYHNPVGELEPLQPLLAAPWVWIARQVEGPGNIQTVLLFNVVVTALTGSLLYLLLCELAFSPFVTLTSVLLFGLGTIAWPYARTFFREPLTTLWLLVAAWSAVRGQTGRKRLWTALTLIGLGLALLTKLTSVLAWPAFFLAFWEGGRGADRRRWLLWLVPAVLIGGVVAAIVFMQRRLGFLFQSWPEVRWHIVQGQLFQRLWGLTLGAGRGMFLFSPVLGLALPGLALMWRRRRTVVLLVGSLLACFLLGYSQYAAWHAGLSWGSRFMLPVIPLLCVGVAGWLEWLIGSRRLWTGLLTAVVIGVSLAIQLAASTGNAAQVATLSAWDNLFDYTHSPALLILSYWRPVHFDMWWWHGPVSPHWEQVYFNPRLALLPVGGLLGAVALLWGALRGRAWAGWRAWAVTTVLAFGGMGVLLWQSPRVTHGYPGVNPAELRQVAEIVNRDRTVPHTVVIVSNDFHLNLLLNYLKGDFVHYWLSPMQTDGFETWLNVPSAGMRRLNLIVDRVHLPPEASGRDAELWLDARLYRYMVDWVGGGYEVYSYLYPPDEMSLQAVDYRWTPGMTMHNVGLTPRDVYAGEPVWLEFHCSAMHKIEGRYDIFVQFLSPEGGYVNGTDGPPQFGAAMTSWWQPGETVVDRRAFFVPDNAPPGMYRVIAGFYINGERLPVFGRQGEPLGTHIELGMVRVH